MKTVLVTGAAGALGRAMVSHVGASEYMKTVSLVRNAGNSVRGDVCCDVRDPECMAAAIDSVRPQLIVHLAATFSDDFDEAYRVNVAAAKHILDAVHKSGIVARVILTGSAAEYGIVRPEENPIAEEHALLPVSVYGVCKAWQTQLVGLFAQRGVDVLCARVFNLYGEGISTRLFAGRLQRQIDEILGGQRAVIETGSLQAVRDYVSLDDAARQIMAIAEYGERGRIYHVGSGIPVSMAEFLRLQLKRYNLEETKVELRQDPSDSRGYDLPMIYADMKKTRMLERQGG